MYLNTENNILLCYLTVIIKVLLVVRYDIKHGLI